MYGGVLLALLHIKLHAVSAREGEACAIVLERRQSKLIGNDR